MSKILKSVTLGDVKNGGIFRALGKEFVKLDADEHGCLVLAKEIWTRMPFREGDDPECPNDLRRSEIMPYLGNCLAEFTKNGTPLSTFIPLRIDLQDTTGQNEYGIFEVRIGLLTLRGYGKYWRLIPKVDAPWWLATPYGTPNCSPYTSNNGGVWRVDTDGSNYFSWYNYSYGVRPAFILPSTLVVSDDGTVSVNTAPTVSTDGAALGQKNAAFAWKYTVRDADGDTLTVTEKLDGKTTKTRTGVASGTALTFEQTASAAGFQKILNGNHTITVEVSDGKETVSTSATFTKAVHAASVTLAEPLAVEGDITVAVLQVTGSIPDDAKLKAEVTNNAKDAAPVWQDATTEVKKGVNIVFENKTATNGAAFNFRVSVERGESGEGGYIEAVSGAFE